jgi:hypothetical protein
MATTPAPAGEECGTCKFYFTAGKDTTKGNCFRHPPQVVIDPTNHSTPAMDLTAKLPTVSDTDWCGDYQAIA